MPPTKIAYLLGAGATHAEIINLRDSVDVKNIFDENFLYDYGLLISDVSKRVMKKAQANSTFKKDVQQVTHLAGPINIELLISLIETHRIPDAALKAKYLKELVEKDITKVLSKWRNRFWLHKALLELHSIVKKEEVVGVVSLNYDDVLDQAYRSVHDGARPNYCHTSEKGQGFPCLKLHGSFNWRSVKTYGRPRRVSIIPLGINKNYLIPPYNFIWSRALEILSQCDILRIIGCSLSQNDFGLVDMLFKAHLERSRRLEMQIINSQEAAEEIKRAYGFFRGIVTPKDIEESLIADDLIIGDPQVSNPFRIWLRAKALRMLDDGVSGTKYLRRCL